MSVFIKSSVEGYKKAGEKNALVSLEQIATICTDDIVHDGEVSVYHIVMYTVGGDNPEIWQYESEKVRDADYSIILKQLDVLDLCVKKVEERRPEDAES